MKLSPIDEQTTLTKRMNRLWRCSSVYLAAIFASQVSLVSSFQPLLRHVGNVVLKRPTSITSSAAKDNSIDKKNENATNKKKTMDKTLEFQLHSSIANITRDDWDACLTPSSSPFLHHSWLRCLEQSKCASPSTGWVPQHVSIRLNGDVAGFVPLYIKGHSLGEFIFDQQFANAAYRSGIEYYPKLLVAVPFTPATGERILWHPDRVRNVCSKSELGALNRAVAEFLKSIAVTNQLSSVHMNFLTDNEATDVGGPLEATELLADGETSSIQSRVQALFKRIEIKDNYLRRTSLQYHWWNKNPENSGKPFETFEDYLGCFKSKKRINIKRERRKVFEDEKVAVTVVAGKDILKYGGLVERMFEIYLSTIDKMMWGRQYLTVEFFQKLSQSDFIDYLVFVCARKNVNHEEPLKADDVFAGTFNIVKDGVFYGRYWGCLPGNEVKNLHFECCYWSAIEYCIDKGLQRMEPGAGGGDYKFARGFDPALIHSVHYISHPGLRRAIGQFLMSETESNVEVTKYLLAKSAVGKKATV